MKRGHAAVHKFKTPREEAQVDLEARKQSISAILNPLAQTLDTYQRERRELSQGRDREPGTVGEQLRQVATEELRRSALRQRRVRRPLHPQRLIPRGRGRAVESYNKAVDSLENRVLPTARKLESLEVGAKRGITELDPIEQAVRQLAPGRLELE